MTDLYLGATVNGRENLAHYSNQAVKNADAVGGNPMFTYFGSPQSGADRDLLASDSARYTNFQEWDAFKGQNPFITELVNLQVIGSKSFYTSEQYGLPIRYTDQKTFKLHEMIFDTPFAHREPTESVARVVQSGFRERTYQVIRRGLAIEVEHGFFHTAVGRKHFVLTFQNVISGINKTIQYDILVTLLSCRDRTIEWEKRFGHHEKNVDELATTIAKETFILQKSRRGAARVMFKNKKMMKRRDRGAPTCIYTGPDTEPYFHGIGEEDIDYMKAGPAGPGRAMQDPYNVSSFAGMKIFTTDIFNPFEDQLPIDPLVRTRVFGGYTFMADTCSDDKQRVAGHRDVYINDWKRDSHTRISFLEATKNAVNVDDNGIMMLPDERGENIRNEQNENRGTGIRLIDGGIAAETAIGLIEGGEDFIVTARQIFKNPVNVESLHENNKNALAGMEENQDLHKKYNHVESKLTENGHTEARAGFIATVDGLIQDGNQEQLGKQINSMSKTRGFNAAIEGLTAAAPKSENTLGAPDKFASSLVRAMGVDNFHFDAHVQVENDGIGKELFTQPNKAIRRKAANLNGLINSAKDTYKGGKAADHGVILFRPWQEFKTTSAIIMKGGYQVGFTAVGNKDAQFGTDVTSKRHYVHVTLNEKAMVSDPDSIIIQDDIMMQKYVAGRGVGFYTKADLQTLASEGFVTELDVDRPSIISIVVPFCKDKKNILEPCIDLAHSKHKPLDTYLDGFRKEYGFNTMMETDVYGSDDNLINSLCFQDFSIHYNPSTGGFDAITINRGPLGENIYPGMRADAENGEVWKEQAYVKNSSLVF